VVMVDRERAHVRTPSDVYIYLHLVRVAILGLDLKSKIGKGKGHSNVVGDLSDAVGQMKEPVRCTSLTWMGLRKFSFVMTGPVSKTKLV
jgi:hypothetical protein